SSLTMNTRLLALLAILPLLWLSAGWNVIDSSEWQIDNDYAHQHNVASHHVIKICGDHICKSGETYNP
ncbi:MAG: hypothetical protein KGI25_08475, partial [Thaumarchaeota archaeon]|nr:hypothetical protein [Nitrososphaerota archaeon]